MAKQDIRQELDGIITTVDGVSFKETSKNGWKIHTSIATGLKIATVEVDKDVVFLTNNPWTGAYKTFDDFQEPLPVGTFTKIASVSVVPYCFSNPNYICSAWSNLPYSEVYTGTYTTIAVKITGVADAPLPTTVHYVVTVTGF